MHRLLKSARLNLAFASIATLALALTFEFAVVQPALSKAASLLASAAPSERTPPTSLVQVLERSWPAQLKYQVASTLLIQSPSQMEGLGTPRRQATELGLGFFLSLHLSKQELLALHLSQTYMGPGVRGYAQASAAHLGVPLEAVTLEQVAKLIAISHSPALYLASPERLARRTEFLLSTRRP